MALVNEVLDRASLTIAMRQLLGEGRTLAVKREQSAFDNAAEGVTDSLVLFGAGNLGRKTLTGLRTIGIEPLAFTDSNPQIWHSLVEGLKVLPPVEATGLYGTTSTFVITIWAGEGYDRMGTRERQLRDLGCRRVVPFTLLFWKFPEVFLPHYTVDLPHKVHDQADDVLTASEVWSDDASRFEYLAQLRWRLLSDFDGLPNPTRDTTYFPRDLFQLTEHEVFIDCGAYDGDTIRSFLKQPNGPSGRICAFEADPGNFKRLERTLAVLPQHGAIAIYNQAVGASNGSVSFCSSGNSSSYVSPLSGDIRVECVALDKALGDLEPTYVKMDIEGAELDALNGASQLIARCSPVLAICSYHRQDHLWKIPLLIHSFYPDYRFYLRPHFSEGWDLVCYAVPPCRLRSVA
jgi:FkbM family methyltransferase